MNAITARLRLHPSHDPTVADLGFLAGQEVDLWEVSTGPFPVGLFTVAAADLDGDVLELRLRPGRTVTGNRAPAWLAAPGNVVLDVSCRYKWLSPTLLRLLTLAHTTPIGSPAKENPAA